MIKPIYYRLVVVDADCPDEPVTLVERGPLGLCEERGFAAANFGLFRIREDGCREYFRPSRVWILPAHEEDDKEGEHASRGPVPAGRADQQSPG